MRKYIYILIILIITEISFSLYLTFWREHFWNAVSNKDAHNFIQQLIVFTCVALTACFVSGFSGYLVSLTAIKWREILNKKVLNLPLNSRIENMNQRIQQDCLDYPDLFLNLIMGLFKAICYIIIFSVSLLLSFSWTMLVIIIGYSVIGTALAHYIARPLLSLNYQQQRLEATYRNNLSMSNFSECISIMLGLAKKQKNLTYFQQFYSQIGVIIPLIIVAPAYFTGNMSIGLLMRFNSLSATILENMSFGVSSFSTINKLLSCRKRLKEINIL